MQGSKTKEQSSLATISAGLKQLLTDGLDQKIATEISKQLIALYRQGLLRPILGKSASDQATSEVEKRVGIFLDVAGELPKVCRLLVRERVACATKGRLTRETINDLVADRFVRKAVAQGGLDGGAEGIGFGCLDSLLVVVDLWSQEMLDCSTVEEAISILKKVEQINKEIFKDGKTAFIKLGDSSETDGALGKRELDKISTVTAEQLSEICKEKIDLIVTQALKRVKSNPGDRLSLIRSLTPQLLGLMGNPLLVSEFTQRCFDHSGEELQDAALGLLVVLISRHSFEHPAYYSTLYDLVRKRESYSLALLKIIEISLKSRKLSSAVLTAFLKVNWIK